VAFNLQHQWTPRVALKTQIAFTDIYGNPVAEVFQLQSAEVQNSTWTIYWFIQLTDLVVTEWNKILCSNQLQNLTVKLKCFGEHVSIINHAHACACVCVWSLPSSPSTDGALLVCMMFTLQLSLVTKLNTCNNFIAFYYSVLQKYLMKVDFKIQKNLAFNFPQLTYSRHMQHFFRSLQFPCIHNVSFTSILRLWNFKFHAIYIFRAFREGTVLTYHGVSWDTTCI
jgi:hypothetical protein